MEKEWISIDEQPPPDHDLVLCYCEDGTIQIGRRVSNGFPHDCTHWMPLPKPPKQ